MTKEKKIPDDLFYKNNKQVEAALEKAVKEALLMHKRAKNPVATWENNRVVIIPPEEIPE
jgi:hypothetical protein